MCERQNLLYHDKRQRQQKGKWYDENKHNKISFHS